MGRSAGAVVLSPGERAEPKALVRRPTGPQRTVSRARIVLRAAEGAGDPQIAGEVGMSELRAGGRRNEFIAEGIAGLEDRPPRGGRARSTRPPSSG